MSKEIMDLTEVIVQDLTVQELEKRMEMSGITPKSHECAVVMPCAGEICPLFSENPHPCHNILW